MLKRKLVKAVQSLLRIVGRLSKRSATRATRSLMRTLMRRSRRANLPAGFVLPTVTMVMLVVVLLTLAVTMRTFDRAQNARNFRVDQATLQASTPAIERARAKIDQLMNSFSNTPSDIQIDNALKSPIYRFGDETPIAIAYDINNDNTLTLSPSTSANITVDEVARSAWRFPVDTDNDGKFDSYTLYNILFRSPSRATTGNSVGTFNRARIPLESRTPPMPPGGNISDFCAAALGNAAAMAGDSDWFKLNGKLQKSVFVYVATVPLSDADIVGKDPTKYTTGKNSFSSLEYEQDRARIALSNNAVWFDDDVELSTVSNFNLNGRLFTNSNLLVSTTNFLDKPIKFFQVSDPRSCFYNKENSKIVVAGNVANGAVTTDSSDNTGNVLINRFNGANVQPTGTTSAEGISKPDGNVTTTENNGTTVGANTKAYNQRLGTLVTAALWLHDGPPPTPVGNYPNNVPVTKASVSAVPKYPKELSDAFALQFDASPGADPRELLKGQLETYFKERMRRVPFKEIAVGASEATAIAPLPSPLTSSNYQSVFTSDFRPPDNWMRVVQPGTDTPITNLPTLQYLKAQNQDPKDPSQVATAPESLIGDRVLVGNGLPSRWLKDDGNVAAKGTTQPIPNKYWQKPDGSNDTSTTRFRQSFVDTLPDLGNTTRGGFWEVQAAKAPKPYENSGGLRVVTGAGIYYRPLSTEAKINAPSFLPKPVTGDDTVVWPDTMPMKGGLDDPTTTGVNESTAPPHLRMRATVVYHYANNASTTTTPIQKPIACVSSYYDPTNAETARNQDGLPDVSGVIDANTDGVINASDKLADGTAWTARPAGAPNARSNNGVVYSASSIDESISAELTEQAKLRFPDGRLVNKPLADAIANANAGTLTNAGASAIHAAQCAIGILNGTLTRSSSIIPDGAIKEASFLDGREVKTVHRRSTTTPSTGVQWLNWLRIGQVGDLRSNTVNDTYTLPLEQRQPLEIRVTELDLNLLRTTAIANTINPGVDEYLLPNSGVIYATRDDALPDVSSVDDPTSDINAPSQKDLLVSSSDFKLDPSRRPNGIRVINGASLVRGGNTNTYRDVERGLILATNLPVYIRSQKLSGGLEGFNLHKDPAPSSTTLIEEFTNQLITGASFYGRSNSDANPGFDKKFACRKDQRGCEVNGDQWRASTIIADAISLQSNPSATSSNNVFGFWDGFRDNGDYDLNNNRDIDLWQTSLGTGYSTADFDTAPTPVTPPALPTTPTGNNPATPVNIGLRNGFLYDNFVTSADWAAQLTPANLAYDGYPRKLTASASDTTNKNFMTSYLVNGVTPVQRRVTGVPEYLMEVCPKLPVSQCGPQDWTLDGSTLTTATAGVIGVPFAPTIHKAGSTGVPADITLRRFPRRVAFKRDGSGQLLNSSGATVSGSGLTALPVPLGISSAGNIVEVPYSAAPSGLRTTNRSLWFQTTTSIPIPPASTPLPYLYPTSGGSATVTYQGDNLLLLRPIDVTKPKDQPLLVPILNIHSATGTPAPTNTTTVFGGTTSDAAKSIQAQWMMRSSAGITSSGAVGNPTIYNATFVSRNSPSRPTPAPGETGGGLHNFLRLMEHWGTNDYQSSSTTARTLYISGNFIQSGQSQYSTGPFLPADPSVLNNSRLFYTLSSNQSVYRWASGDQGFLYRGGAFNRRSPFYFPATRNWGFDVGILSQMPDLFGQRFTGKAVASSVEYFRGMNRDDTWVKNLLCAAAPDTQGNYTQKALASRPTTVDQNCPALPYPNQ
jgi:Tfp pilus assembly protein PilX